MFPTGNTQGGLMFPVVDIAAECTVHRSVQGEGLDQLPRRAPLRPCRGYGLLPAVDNSGSAVR